MGSWERSPDGPEYSIRTICGVGLWAEGVSELLMRSWVRENRTFSIFSDRTRDRSLDSTSVHIRRRTAPPFERHIIMLTTGRSSTYLAVAARGRGHSGACAPAEKGRAPAVPRQSKNSGAATEKDAPVKILVPQLCPGSRKILAPPLQKLDSSSHK
jgi:hypothetical protein